jgi:predicted SAM-dependent methyltransferase
MVEDTTPCLKLDLGSGGKPAPHLGEGWLGVDYYVAQADLLAAMDDLPFDDAQVTAIYTSHALEHLGRDAVLPTLREWYRVLQHGGTETLEIRVPDLEWCVQHWLQHKDQRGWNLDIIFGNQNHEGEYHKTGFTLTTLVMLVQQAGFVVDRTDVLQSHGQPTLAVYAHKP